MSANTKVDVLGALREFATKRDPFGSADEAMRKYIEARDAVAELIEAAREVSADMRYLMGRASAEGHDSGQSLAQQTSAKIDAALARIGGASHG